MNENLNLAIHICIQSSLFSLKAHSMITLQRFTVKITKSSLRYKFHRKIFYKYEDQSPAARESLEAF